MVYLQPQPARLDLAVGLPQQLASGQRQARGQQPPPNSLANERVHLDGSGVRVLSASISLLLHETVNVHFVPAELAGNQAKPGGLIITYVQSDLPLIDEWTRLISATTTVIDELDELSEVT